MKVYVCLLVVVLVFSAGCEKETGAGQGGGGGVVCVKREPVYAAEVHVQKGRSDVTSWLVSSYECESETKDVVGGSVSTKRWKEETSSISFDLKNGREVKICGTFLEHKDGCDIWQIEMVYTVSEGPAGEEISRTSKVLRTVGFDGLEAVLVFEDDDHSIFVRSRGVDGGE